MIARHRRTSARSRVRPDPGLARGYNWEYSAVLQHELLPRMSVTAGYYRRDFYNLQVTDNQNLAPSDWTRATRSATPTDPRLPLSGQPIPLYTLNPARSASRPTTCITFSTQNKTTYNGVEFTRERAPRQVPACSAASRPTAGHDDLRRFDDTTGRATARATTRTALRFCDCDRAAGSARRSRRRRAYTFPYDIQLSGSFCVDSRPGRQRQLHRDVGDRRPADHRIDRRRRVDGRQPGRAEHVFLDYQNRLDLRVGKTFRFDRYEDPGLHGRLQRVQRGHGR